MTRSHILLFLLLLHAWQQAATADGFITIAFFLIVVIARDWDGERAVHGV